MKRLLLTFGVLAFGVVALPVLSTSSGSALSAAPGPRTYKLYCASDDFYRHFCPINAYGGVEIIRQKSEASCIYGRTWGVAGDSIWVDRGCRADFAVGASAGESYRDDSYRGGERVLAEDAGMIGAAYVAQSPGKRAEVIAELTKRGTKLATEASTRFIMYWETDANDVDFHIRDARGGHAWYSHKQLGSGGELYADITTGYVPECFAIPGIPKAGPYHLSIDYYSQGPMGYGMGLLEIQRFDGKGKLAFEDRPYVIMNDHAFVDLGTWKP